MTVVNALKSSWLRKLWPWILSSLPVLVLLEYQAVAPVGHWSLLIFEVPYIAGLLASLCALVVLPLGLLRRRSRLGAFAWLIASMVYLLLAIGGLALGRHVRSWGFDRLALRSAPLVTAIRAYAEAQGEPPSTLKELVPAYLVRVPGTGMMAYPHYLYYSGAKATNYHGNPWVLIVYTPSGGINFDQFMYFPLQNYPEDGYGGSLVRIRDWAYVHE